MIEMGISPITQMPCRTVAPPKGCAMTDEKKKDKKEKKDDKDAKKVDDEQLKDVAGGVFAIAQAVFETDKTERGENKG